jgi:predicted amidohydrolase
LICHEWRYPELYREYKRMNVELIFQSFYDGGLSEGDYIYEGKEQGDLITGTLKGYAANNHLWISASNTGKRESCFPSLVIQPDGIIRNKLRRNMPGVLITEIDLDEQFIDPSGTWRGDILRKYLFS